MAWQRTGCSHDGGTNVLGQTPLDYAQVSPRGGGGGVVGDTTFQRGGAGYTSPRDQPGNNTDRGQRGGKNLKYMDTEISPKSWLALNLIQHGLQFMRPGKIDQLEITF